MAPLPKRTEEVDYGGVEIKKMPAGAAFGADDLKRWSQNRLQGRYGSGLSDYTAARIECKKCGQASEVLAGRSVKVGDKKTCRHCGFQKARVVKVKKKGAVR